MAEHRVLRLYLVESSQVLQTRMTQLFEESAHAQVVGIAADAHAAIDGICALTPDVVIVDIRLRTGTGFDVLKSLGAMDAKRRPTCIVLAGDPDPAYRLEAARLGAHYFFDKPQEILDAVTLVSGLVPRSPV